MIDTRKIFTRATSIEALSSEIHQIHWRIPQDLPYFDGHFPHFPIFPAVAIMDGSLEFINQVTRQNVSLRKLLSAKFLGPLLPNSEVLIKLTRNAPADWLIEWFVNSNRLAELRLTTSVGVGGEDLIDKV